MDIQWLQRDCGVYVVNMFDTGQAARVLGLQRFGLAYLLHQYCQLDVDKQFQLADWRIRSVCGIGLFYFFVCFFVRCFIR